MPCSRRSVISFNFSAGFPAVSTIGITGRGSCGCSAAGRGGCCYWLYPTVRSEEDYGYYLIDELDELELPEEAKKYFKYEEYGRDAVSKDKGLFTEQGYIYNNQNTFTEWYRGTENEIPKEYRVMSFPQPERGGQDKTFMDAAATEQTARTAAEQPL